MSELGPRTYEGGCLACTAQEWSSLVTKSEVALDHVTGYSPQTTCDFLPSPRPASRINRPPASWPVEGTLSMSGSRRPQAFAWAVGLLWPIACLAQSPRFTFNPSNYHPPAGEAPPSPSLFRVLEGITQRLGKFRMKLAQHSFRTGTKRHRPEYYSTESHIVLVPMYRYS